jgi:hypothetical protein
VSRIKEILAGGRNALVKRGYLSNSLWEGVIYISHPLPVKPNFKYIYKKMKGELKDNQLQRRTLPDIQELLTSFRDKPVIAIDNIENLTPTAALSYYRLFTEGFRFIASQHKDHFNYYGDPDVKRFLNTFDIANPDYVENILVERDLTPVVIFGASLIFLGYFFKAYVMAENSPNTFYVAVIGIFWAVFLLTRTIIYVSYAHRGARGGKKY